LPGNAAVHLGKSSNYVENGFQWNPAPLLKPLLLSFAALSHNLRYGVIYLYIRQVGLKS
jgi:hypothetical protein